MTLDLWWTLKPLVFKAELLFPKPAGPILVNSSCVFPVVQANVFGVTFDGLLLSFHTSHLICQQMLVTSLWHIPNVNAQNIPHLFPELLQQFINLVVGVHPCPTKLLFCWSANQILSILCLSVLVTPQWLGVTTLPSGACKFCCDPFPCELWPHLCFFSWNTLLLPCLDLSFPQFPLLGIHQLSATPLGPCSIVTLVGVSLPNLLSLIFSLAYFLLALII